MNCWERCSAHGWGYAWYASADQWFIKRGWCSPWCRRWRPPVHRAGTFRRGRCPGRSASSRRPSPFARGSIRWCWSRRLLSFWRRLRSASRPCLELAFSVWGGPAEAAALTVGLSSFLSFTPTSSSILRWCRILFFWAFSGNTPAYFLGTADFPSEL